MGDLKVTAITTTGKEESMYTGAIEMGLAGAEVPHQQPSSSMCKARSHAVTGT